MRHHILVPILALTCPLASQMLVAIDSSRVLYTIDASTGARTAFGNASVNAATTGGLAFDPATSRVWLTSTSADSVYTLDLATGAATLVGPYGDSAIIMHGLEFDTSTNTLYGASSHNGGLYVIDQTTGAATLVGTTGLSSFHNLCHDPLTDVMYVTNSGTDSFYTIDRATAAVTLIGPLNGPTNPNGLAFDSTSNQLYLTCNNTDTLYTVDTNTGAATAVGPHGAGNILGLVYLPAGGITRHRHGCGQATLSVTGLGVAGATLDCQLSGVSGLGFIGLGFVFNPQPFCVCTLGHEWATTNFTNNLLLAVPTTPVLSGLPVAIQGADFLSTSGCPAPALALTDTFTTTIL